MEATTINTTTTAHSATTTNSNKNNNNQHEHESKDEVDFVVVATNNNNNNIVKHNINNNYEMNISKINNNSNKLTTTAAVTATENKEITINNNSSNNSNSKNSNNININNNKNNNNNNNNNHRSNNNSSSEIVPKSLTLKETTQNQVPKNNKDSSSTSTSATPAPNMQNDNNNTNINSSSRKKITVAVQQPHTNNSNNNQQQQQPTKKHSTKERLSLFSFSKKISQKSTAATVATVATSNNINSSNSNSSTNIGSYKDNTTETTTPAPPNTTSYECENQSRTVALEKYKPLSLPCDTPAISLDTTPSTPRHHHKFAKSTSLSRLFSNTYNAKKFEKQEQKRLANDIKFNTYGGRRRLSGPYLERFKRYAKEEGDALDTNIEVAAEARERNATAGGVASGNCNELQHSTTETVERHEDLGAKAMRTISRGLGKLWWKRTHSVEISTPDPEFKVSYLGNVLTGWAKGEGCVEKQLNTLWRNYTQNSKPDVIMRIKVCASGLKATTRQHGLTEYWANRITHCCAPKNYPRVFCWIYRHEGRKLKHELRCHAVLCSKEKIVQDICNTLKENLERALREFKREKILKQNARLSLANAAYDNPSLPRRKILLSVGGNNYRPPLERSKSAPKLMAIEEAIGEEDGDDIEETNEPEMKSCCQKDSLYPAMTLGRRRCRRGHSIRRTGGKARASVSFDESAHKHAAGECCKEHHHDTKDKVVVDKLTKNDAENADEKVDDEQRNSYGSDESDDFEKLLKYNNYDTNASLEHELLPYFDMQLHKNHSSLGDLTELKDEIEQPLSLMPTINSAPNADPEAEYIPSDVVDEDDDGDAEVLVGLRRNGVCSDGEEDYLDADDMYFRQASILNMLHRNSMRKMANLSLSSGDESSSIETNASSGPSLQYRHQMQSSISSNASSTGTSASSALDGGDAVAKAAAQRKQQQLNADSDEGSISSGCETASTVTANQDDISLKYRQQSMQRSAAEIGATMNAAQLMMSEHDVLEEEPVTADEIYQRLESRLQRRQNSDATTFSSSSSITLKLGGSSPTTSMSGGGGNDVSSGNGVGSCVGNGRTRRQRRQSASTQRSSAADGDSDDSECSDESGYVEFQERDKQTLMREGEFMLNGAQSVDTKATALLKQQQQQQQPPTKPQPPPKPMPRRLLLSTGSGSTSTAV